jgi:hypothetical protein
MLRMAVDSLGIQSEVLFADLRYDFVVSFGLSTVTGVCFNLPLRFTLLVTNIGCRFVICDLVGLWLYIRRTGFW